MVACRRLFGLFSAEPHAPQPFDDLFRPALAGPSHRAFSASAGHCSAPARGVSSRMESLFLLSDPSDTELGAEDGEIALDKVREVEPDLILLDNIMPRLSGWEVTKILKTDEDFAAYRDIPVIMFSAMDDVKDKVEGFELGIEDYIIKPFNFSELNANQRSAAQFP